MFLNVKSIFNFTENSAKECFHLLRSLVMFESISYVYHIIFLVPNLKEAAMHRLRCDTNRCRFRSRQITKYITPLRRRIFTFSHSPASRAKSEFHFLTSSARWPRWTLVGKSTVSAGKEWNSWPPLRWQSIERRSTGLIFHSSKRSLSLITRRMKWREVKSVWNFICFGDMQSVA